MNTTLDIPEELYRQAEAQAARENRELKDLVSEGLRMVLARSVKALDKQPRRMENAPVPIQRGNVIPVLSNDEMAILLERSGERLP